MVKQASPWTRRAAGEPARVFLPCSICQRVPFQDCANNRGSLASSPRDLYSWLPCSPTSLSLPCSWPLAFPHTCVRPAALEAAGCAFSATPLLPTSPFLCPSGVPPPALLNRSGLSTQPSPRLKSCKSQPVKGLTDLRQILVRSVSK